MRMSFASGVLCAILLVTITPCEALVANAPTTATRRASLMSTSSSCRLWNVHQQEAAHPRRCCDTALGMGLRSFLSRKLRGGKNKKEDDTSPSSQDDVSKKDQRDVILEIDQDYSDDDEESESTQERILRMKSGQMTEEEKQAFIRTALTASTTSTSGTPLRQPIPQPEEPDVPKQPSSASPFPQNLRNIATRGAGKKRGDDEPDRQGRREKFDSDRKKREYVEMVTNPDRFKTYITSDISLLDTGVDDDLPLPKGSGSDDKKNETDTETTSSSAAAATGASSNNLASRLEAAAAAQEKQSKDNRQKQEAMRLKREQKLAETLRQRNEEIAQREAESLARQREQREAQKKAEEEARRAEKARLEQMMAAQDAYWQKKLKEEKEAQLKALTEEEKEESLRKAVEEEEHMQEYKMHELEKEQERAKLREDERQREDPHEGEILKEAEEEIIHDREETWKIMEKSAAREKGDKAPLPDIPDVSVSTFLRQQAQEKANLDKAKDTQLEKLKTLNSPLPSQPPSVGPSTTPIMQQGRRPQTSSGNPSLGGLSQLINKGGSASRSEAAPPPEPSVQEMMKRVAAEEEDDDEEDLPESTGGRSLGPLSRLLGNQKKPKEPESPVPAAFSGSPKTKSIRQPLPSESGQTKKPVVRQKLPLEEEDDFDEFSRNSPNKNMSVKDAMAKKTGESGDRSAEDPMTKSKKWGIDMSKYQD